MTKKNFLILGAVLLIIAIVAWLGIAMPRQRSVTLPSGGDDSLSLTVTTPTGQTYTLAPVEDSPSSASSAQTPAPSTAAGTSDTQEDEEVSAYLLATVNGIVFEPVPLLGEDEYTITQKAADMENLIHVTKDSIVMASSTCENQDCVKQGVVSLKTRETRVLGNMIICLPNGVTLELLTPEEAAEILNDAE